MYTIADRLKQTLDDLRHRKITLETAMTQLEFIDWDEEVRQNRKNQNRLRYSKDILYAAYDQPHNKTPEEVLVYRERIKEIYELITLAREILTKKQFDVLWMIAVEGKTQKQIAEKYNVLQPAVAKYVQRITEKLLRKPQLRPYKELLEPQQSSLEAHYGNKYKVRYPVDYLKAVNCGGHYSKNGKYVSDSKCVYDDYLTESFGDNVTCCNYCGNRCTNQEMIERLGICKITK